MKPSRPHDNTYWVEPDRLLAGEYPGAPLETDARGKLHAYLQAGITCFLDLTEPHELEPYAPLLHEEAALLGLEVQHRRMPIHDVSVPRTTAEMHAILDAIDQALADGHRVYPMMRQALETLPSSWASSSKDILRRATSC